MITISHNVGSLIVSPSDQISKTPYLGDMEGVYVSECAYILLLCDHGPTVNCIRIAVIYYFTFYIMYNSSGGVIKQTARPSRCSGINNNI